MSESVPLTKEDQGKLWGELKQRWAILKNQSSPEGDKTSAKRRINEIQKTLSLDVTDFTKPYVKGEAKTQTTQTTVSATISPKPTNTFRKDILNDFMATALPIAVEYARQYAPDEDNRSQLIIAQAFLKPMGVVFASLVGNLGKK